MRIAPRERAPQPIENYTPSASAGAVRELDALQVLRASPVGGMFDARLEINIYRLLHLADLLENSDLIQDAHLLIALRLLGHALGFLSK